MSTEIKFSEESLALVNKIIKRYPEGKQKSALLPVLHLAQAEFEGWLSVPVMDYVASILKILGFSRRKIRFGENVKWAFVKNITDLHRDDNVDFNE